LVVLSAALLQAGSLRADNVISAGTAASIPGHSVALPIFIENDIEVAAYSFGLIHEASSLTPISIVYAGAAIPDFIGSSVTPDGIAFGVLIDFQLEEVIPAGGPSLVAYATYDVLAAGQGSFTPVTPGTAGNPPIDVVFALPDATEVTPTVSPGGVAVLSPDPDGSPTNRVRVAFEDSFSAFSLEGVLLESEVTSPGAPTDLLVGRNGLPWLLMAETQTVCRVGINPEPKIVVSTGPEPRALGSLGENGVFVTYADGTIQTITSNGVVTFGGDGVGDSPEDGALGAALSIGSSPVDLIHFAAGPGSTSWLGGGESLLRIQPNGNVVVDVDTGPGYPIQDLAAGPGGSVYVLHLGRVDRRVADGSKAAYVELPPGIAPTKLAVTTIGVEDADGNIHRVDRLFVLNPSSNQVFSYYWDLDDVVVEAPTINHSRGVQDIACDGNRQLWIAGQEAGTTDATLTAYNFDGTPTGIDLTFPGQAILLTENSAAIPVARKFDADDPDGDQYPNLEEMIAGSNPYDGTRTPVTEIPNYVEPVESFSAEVVDGTDVQLSWTWNSPAAGNPDFYEITHSTDGVAGDPVLIEGTETSWIDDNGGDGLPDGIHEYGIFVIMAGSSDGTTTLVVIGSGATESETPIDVPGSDEPGEIYDATLDKDALPGAVKYYLTDPANNKIYACKEDLEIVGVISSPFEDGKPVSGISYIKNGYVGQDTLVVGNGASGGQMCLIEMTLTGDFIRYYYLYNPLPAVPNGQKFLPGAIAGKSGGMGYDENSGHLYITGPDTCEIFGMLHGGDGAINAEQSFPHPNEGAQQKGCTTGNCPGSPWVGCTAPIYITSQTADGTLEIIEVSVSGGVATQVGEGITLAAIDDPGGILFDGENFIITGNSDGTVYEVQATGNFTRGDPNEDGVVDIGDPIYELSYLFVNGPAPECIARLDANDDNLVDIADTIFLLTFLFNNGPQPPEPFDVAGPDPTPSSVTPCP
jgi:hypothetical protein